MVPRVLLKNLRTVKFPTLLKGRQMKRFEKITSKGVCFCFRRQWHCPLEEGFFKKSSQMSQKKHKDETEENENGEEKEKEAEAGTSQEESEKNKSKKEKRVLRFQLPVGSAVHSEESFTSALSFTSSDGNYENHIPPATEPLPFLKKYAPPLPHSEPRNISLNPCFQTQLQEAFVEEEKTAFSSLLSSSSRQLFEVVKNSPTPSEADINLINSTYLRKLEAVKEAIKNGADINTFRERQTPLLIATEIGDHRLVSYFLSVPSVNPDFQNVFGQTPLIVAVRNAFDKIVRLLLSHNADVNIADNMGKTPLHGALFQQRPHIARLLLAYGADYEKQDCFGERPMYTSAVKKPHTECLLILLRSGASPNYSNVSGVPLLSRAILNSTDFTIIEALVQYGASVNAFDLFTRKTPLHFAAVTNDIRTAQFLIDRGADPNIRTVYNFTPYEEALFHRSTQVASYLANLTVKSSQRFRPSVKY